MHKTIYKTYAIDNADIVRMSAQGPQKKKVWNFCKMDLINDQARKGNQRLLELAKFRFETIIVDNK